MKCVWEKKNSKPVKIKMQEKLLIGLFMNLTIDLNLKLMKISTLRWKLDAMTWILEVTMIILEQARLQSQKLQMKEVVKNKFIFSLMEKILVIVPLNLNLEV